MEQRTSNPVTGVRSHGKEARRELGLRQEGHSLRIGKKMGVE
jgi:hypothetical protein